MKLIKAIKRLDKAVTLLKVGAKIIKKVLKSQGYENLKPEFNM
jgi:hypothetical protein